MVKRFNPWTLAATLVFAWVSLPSYAVPPTPGFEYQLGNQAWFASKLSACSDYMAFVGRTATNSSYHTPMLNEAVGEYGGCYWKRNYADDGAPAPDVSPTPFKRRAAEVCPVGTTLNQDGTDCVSGGGTSDACVGSMAKDKTFIRNWTVGYSRSPDETDTKFVGPVNRLPGSGKAVCMGGCKSVQQDTSAPGWKAWISQTPTDQGLYRNSLDVPFTSTGETCTEGTGSSPPVDPQTPAPPCPGYVGEVNGIPGCYGTASNPITPENKHLPPVVIDAGNPPAGSGPIAPNTGESRTPSSGGGGPAGGPAGAAVGGKGGAAGGTPSKGGDGTVAKPGEGKEQQACGAPGQPVCDVKIKEGEMPGLGDTFKESKETLDSAWKTQGEAFEYIEKIPTNESLWTFSFEFPKGCTPFDTGISGFVMDPCKYQSTIHDLMSMVWAAVTVFLLIGMVGKTLRST